MEVCAYPMTNEAPERNRKATNAANDVLDLSEDRFEGKTQI